MKKSIWILAFAATAAFSQPDDAIEESHFHNAGIAVRLLGSDSVFVTFGAGSEDLQNTVTVFPYGDNDSANFRLFESRIESYLQARIPVTVDGRKVDLRVVQWKPYGAGRADRLDMPSLYVQNLYITLAGRLPPKPKRLDITANIWVERRDAAETTIQYSFFKDDKPLRRLWSLRERTVRFPLAADSIKAMLANPPAPVRRAAPEDLGDPGEHQGHRH